MVFLKFWPEKKLDDSYKFAGIQFQGELYLSDLYVFEKKAV